MTNLCDSCGQLTTSEPTYTCDACRQEEMDRAVLICRQRDEAEARVAELEAQVPRWVCARDQSPPPGKTVRVCWVPSCKQDAKLAIWTGGYWSDSRRTGSFCTPPDYWLFEPTIPAPPTE